jgi:hypothetical protein
MDVTLLFSGVSECECLSHLARWGRELGTARGDVKLFYIGCVVAGQRFLQYGTLKTAANGFWGFKRVS